MEIVTDSKECPFIFVRGEYFGGLKDLEDATRENFKRRLVKKENGKEIEGSGSAIPNT